MLKLPASKVLWGESLFYVHLWEGSAAYLLDRGELLQHTFLFQA